MSTLARPTARDSEKLEELREAILASCARLNEERAGILADIRQRGRVFPVLTA